MPRGRRVARVAAFGLGGVVLLVAVGLLLVTGTGPGREWVRGFALDALADVVQGRVHIGALDGNLLSGAVLHDVIIEDEEGGEFLRAESASVRYGLLPMVRGRIVLRDLHLENPTVVLDQPPGGEWNFARIFPANPEAAADTTQGFISRISLHDVSVSGGQITVRLPWEPDASLDGAAREAAVAAALDTASRARIETAEGGWQQIMEFQDVHATFPLIRLVDPDTDVLLFDLESGQMNALAFRPPAARIEDLAARILLEGDSILFEDLRAELPGTRISGEFAWSMEDAGGRGALEVSELSFADLRWLRPDLPDGEGSARVAVDMESGRTHVVARDVDLAVDSARVSGDVEMAVGERLELGEMDVAFRGVGTDLVQQLMGEEADPLPAEGSLRGAVQLSGPPGDLTADGWTEFTEPEGSVSRLEVAGGLGTTGEGGLQTTGLRLTMAPVRASLLRQFSPELPAGGVLTGFATLSGPLDGTLDVEAEVVHTDPRAGRSRVLADGEVNAATAALNDMRLRLAPVQLALLRGAAPDLPLGGILEGTATLSGWPSDRLTARMDLVHSDTTGLSQVEGTAVWMAGGPTPQFLVDLAIPTLALPTVGLFVPGAGLRGVARGSLQADGTLAQPRFAMQLVAADSGSVAVEGSLDSSGPDLRYDARATLVQLDAAALSSTAPAMELSGTLSLEGVGTDPATASLALEAALVDLRRDTLGADTSRVRARVADGVVDVEQGDLVFGPARATVEGSFGLVADRSGTLRYLVEVDSLQGFADLAPQDSTMILPRPLARARRVVAARLDSMRIAEATEVERAATGSPPPPALIVDSLPAITRDALSGAVRVEGTLAGNLDGFGVDGTAEADELVAFGTTADALRARYTLVDFLTPDADAALEVDLAGFTAAGFAFDSARVDLGYRGIRNQGTGTLSVGLFQDDAQDYRVASEFLLEVDRRELTFADLVMRFDTVIWTAPHPGSVRFAGGDLTVDSLELVTPVGPGRLMVDGTLPAEGEADLRIVVERLPLSQVSGLLQDTTSATGLFDLEAHLSGTRRAPRLEGTTALSTATFGGRPLPDVMASWTYADRSFQATAEASDDGLSLMTVEAELPIDLALEGVDGERMLDEPMRVVIRADSLPLEALPSFSEAVADVQGRLRADVTVGGSMDNPDFDGTVDLSLASFRVVPAGVLFRDLVGSARFDGREIMLDSLRAISGSGPILIQGAIDASELARPSFDLALNARRALLLDNELGRVTTDADLTLTGPLDSTRIEGSARVREGVIRVPEVGETRRYTSLDAPEILASIDTSAVDEELLPTPNPFLENMRVDVALRVDRNTWVRNSATNVEIHTPDDVDPLRILMNVDEPGLVLDGAMNADRGEYTFSGRVFTLTTGSAVFLPGGELDPLLQLSANYEVAQPGREALVIQIHVAGTLSNPRVALESSATPPLSESDLLSYLAFGRSSTSLFSSGGSGLAGGGGGGGIGALAQQQLATMAIGALLDEAVADVEREGSRAGLDIFRIRPADLPPELAFSGQFGNFLRGTEVVLGRYLGPRLFVAAQGRTTTEAWPGLRMEYRAPGGFSFEGTWEPRYLPSEPTLITTQTAESARVLGAFLFWNRRF